MAWKSDGLGVDRGSFINPFCISKFGPGDYGLAYFWTERLPGYAGDLQWTMLIQGEASVTRHARGNEALASQHSRPKWLKKHEYLTFCSLRAYPCQQLRKLLVAMQEASLPWNEPAVQHLLRQLLHQTGPVKEGELYWKTDMVDLLGEFQVALLALVDEFVAKPRDHQALPTLADILNYLLQWSDPLSAAAFAEGCRRLSQAALQWARDALNQMQGLASKRQEALRVKAAVADLVFSLQILQGPQPILRAFNLPACCMFCSSLMQCRCTCMVFMRYCAHLPAPRQAKMQRGWLWGWFTRGAMLASKTRTTCDYSVWPVTVLSSICMTFFVSPRLLRTSSPERFLPLLNMFPQDCSGCGKGPPPASMREMDRVDCTASTCSMGSPCWMAIRLACSHRQSLSTLSSSAALVRLRLRSAWMHLAPFARLGQ